MFLIIIDELGEKTVIQQTKDIKIEKGKIFEVMLLNIARFSIRSD